MLLDVARVLVDILVSLLLFCVVELWYFGDDGSKRLTIGAGERALVLYIRIKVGRHVKM